MGEEKLGTFLLKANQAGYASGSERNFAKQPDGSTTIVYESGDFTMNDNYFGGEPYGGREVVFFKDKPVWLMAYYGWVKEGVETTLIYPFLQKALRAMPEKYPFRGPKQLTESRLTYANSHKGTLARFSGVEHIYLDEETVYEAHYIGGWVAIR